MSWKSKKKAEATKEAAGTSNQPVDCPAQCCPGQTHFFKLKVQDSDGQPAPMVKPTIALNDGSTLTGVVLDAQGEFTTGNVLDLTSECKVSLPELYDADWWPEGSSPGNVSTNQSLTIAEGDCVVKLAQDNGFLDYQSIWGQSANEPLRKKHPNPNSLLVGDQLAAPDTKTRVVPSPVDQTCKFVIRASKPPKLRVVLVDKQQKPLDGCEWEITEPTALKGKTDATGLIQIDPLDPSYVAGKLKAKVKKPAPPPPPAAPPPPPANPPRYPPPITETQFKDDPPPKPEDPGTMEWSVRIGSLPSHKEKTGVLERLHNLGFQCDASSGDDTTKRCVESFQRNILKTRDVTGNVADVMQPIDDLHSNP